MDGEWKGECPIALGSIRGFRPDDDDDDDDAEEYIQGFCEVAFFSNINHY